MKPIFILALLLITAITKGQDFGADFKTISVNKKLSEFSDSFDLSSPLKSFITYNYVLINGKDHLLWTTNTTRNWSFLPDSTAPNSEVSDNFKDRLLNANIHEVIFYKDSVAFVISHVFSEFGESYYPIRSFYLEGDRWVNSGESARNHLMDAHQFIRDRAEMFFQDFQETQRLYKKH